MNRLSFITFRCTLIPFRFSLIILIMGLIVAASCAGNTDHKSGGAMLPEKSLSRLNHTIVNSTLYSLDKTNTLDSMKSRLANIRDDEKWSLLVDISSQYRQFNTDSAIRYARLAAASIPYGLPEQFRIKGSLAVANALSTSGLFTPAIQILDSIHDAVNSIDAKVEYWKSARILYSYMLAFVQNHGEYADLFRKRYISCDDSLLRHLPKAEPFYQFIYSERLVSDGRWEDASRMLQTILDTNPMESNIYGMAAYQLAEVYKNKGDFKGYAECLVLAAESDIKGCVREGVALPSLANWLYSQGDIENAFNFINFALEEANSGNIRMRTATIMPMMPIIDKTYRQKIDTSKNLMMGYLIVAVVLFIIAATLSAWLTRTLHHNKNNERRLAESSRTLEAYVGNFIGLCSNYSTRLDQLAKLVTRKLAAGQTAELQKLVASGRFAEDDNEEFYRLIDKAILDIFPDFVSNINSLLLPENRIVLKPDEILTPELRIYAFIRLGVDQSSRIAQILHYSVNTVYSYRNRMRNKAVDRDSFDTDVRNLGRNDSFLSVLISE